MPRILIVIFSLVASICVADAFGIGQGNRLGKMGASPKGGTAAPPSTCTNGNLQLAYNDSCQLMSQMVGN